MAGLGKTPPVSKADCPNEAMGCYGQDEVCHKTVTRCSQGIMQMKAFKTATLIVLCVLGSGFVALARDQVRIVGSSTVFPFSTTVAEKFGKLPGQRTPVVESTGTGGGFRLLCAGVGTQYPDIANASRRVTESELKNCAANNVSVTEVKIGYDGIVFSYAASGPAINLTQQQLWLAIAKQVPVNGKLAANPHRRWKQIDASLPDTEIIIYGPAANHGTRDAVVELVLDPGCKDMAEVKAIPDAKARQTACRTVREDGAWVDVADAYNVTVDRTLKTPGALGIIGFGFYENNRARLKVASINGIEPTFDSIASGKFPVARSMFFYVKREHATVVPGLKEFLTEFTSRKASGEDGYLVDKGLIPMPDDELASVRQDASALKKLENLGP
jgi:phosphate transport system substrate-binding protein